MSHNIWSRGLLLCTQTVVSDFWLITSQWEIIVLVIIFLRVSLSLVILYVMLLSWQVKWSLFVQIFFSWKLLPWKIKWTSHHHANAAWRLFECCSNFWEESVCYEFYNMLIVMLFTWLSSFLYFFSFWQYLTFKFQVKLVISRVHYSLFLSIS